MSIFIHFLQCCKFLYVCLFVKQKNLVNFLKFFLQNLNNPSKCVARFIVKSKLNLSIFESNVFTKWF